MSAFNFTTQKNSKNLGNLGNLLSGNHEEDDAKLQELLRMAQNNPEILKREYEKMLSQNKPMTTKDYLNPKYEMKLDAEGGVVIEPEQFFVIKSRDSKTKEKFFINVVTHAIVDEPEEKNFVDYDNERGIRLPMSLGSLKEDFDKTKAPCKVVDCVLAPKIADTILKNNEAISFFYQLANNYIQQKYKIELEEEFTLPKMKYKGPSIEFQRVKGKKAPKIETLESEDVPDSAAQAENALKSSLQTGPTMQPVEWKLSFEFGNGEIEQFDGLNENIEQVQKLHFEFELPLLVTGRNIQLNVSEDEVEMGAGKIYQIVLKPPLLVDPNSVNARFDIKKRSLLVIMNKLKKTPAREAARDEGSGQTAQTQDLKAPELSNDLLFDVV